MKHLGLFEGIGGFSLAARWMGWETVAWCEWNEFGQKVLRHHFPNAEGFGDITKTDFKKYEGKIDIITGGFPCQPFSLAGKRKGADDERYLWHEMLRAIQEIKPTFVIAENVFGITNIDGGLVFEQVCLDLEAEGYEVQPFILPAAAKDAPHRRDRVWFIAYSNGIRGNKDERGNNRESNEPNKDGEARIISNTKSIGQKYALEDRELERRRFRQSNKRNMWDSFPTQSPICNGDDGIPNRLVNITFPKWRNESIKAMGNAILPQVAFELFRALHEMQSKPDFWVN